MLSLLPYQIGSKSAKALADALEIKQLRRAGKPVKNRAIINWGCAVPHRLFENCLMLNGPVAVNRAANKLDTFLHLPADIVPPWTMHPEEAKKWLAENKILFARTKLRAHSGEGIVILDKNKEFVKAPLYTERIRRRDEFRLHVFQGNVFHIQRKARKKDVPDEQVNWMIRNHQNGFIYAVNNVFVPDEAKDMAVQAVRALGLDFGAVDMLEDIFGKFYVLEVNTAPGLEGGTLDAYVQQFTRWL